MLQSLANLGEFIGGVAVLATLIYLAYQIRETRAQMQANAMQYRCDSRLNMWLREWDTEALQSARDKFFEFELYRRDCLLHEIEELSQREIRACRQWLDIELLYFQNFFNQYQAGLITEQDARPLKYISCLRVAPLRREWKDNLRLGGHYPDDYIGFVDNIVKKYDRVEEMMDESEDADYNSSYQQVFDVPAPPSWLQGTDLNSKPGGQR